MKRLLFFSTIVALAAFACPAVSAEKPGELTVVIMDPLAAPLSCPCVKGYAQRDYEKLGEFLSKQLGRPVKVHFSESLTNALKKKTEGRADLIIGKESVVRIEAKANGIGAVPIASLTGKDGKTTQTGLFVVAAADKAFTVGDLKGYRLIFGADECDEKHKAALTLLKESGVAPPAKPETCASCSDGATTVIDLSKGGEKAATVISSYAQPLLEGCGTIKKGDLRVIGETAPVPFVVAFANEKLSVGERQAIQSALLEVARHPALCTALETKLGFVAFENGKKK